MRLKIEIFTVAGARLNASMKLEWLSDIAPSHSCTRLTEIDDDVVINRRARRTDEIFKISDPLLMFADIFADDLDQLVDFFLVFFADGVPTIVGRHCRGFYRRESRLPLGRKVLENHIGRIRLLSPLRKPREQRIALGVLVFDGRFAPCDIFEAVCAFEPQLIDPSFSFLARHLITN
jgi:hypothetical protein